MAATKIWTYLFSKEIMHLIMIENEQNNKSNMKNDINSNVEVEMDDISEISENRQKSSLKKKLPFFKTWSCLLTSILILILLTIFIMGIYYFAVTTSSPRPVILITGGYFSERTAEIYLPSDNSSCSLPELPDVRAQHTQDGPWACGGRSDLTFYSCVKWNKGSWTRSRSLRERRYNHVSWATASGLYLMGGAYSERTSVLVTKDGSVKNGFKLQYQTT